MKKDFMKKLEAELIYYKIQNKDEILDKYEKRYDFGLEAGLTNEKVEDMLGSPEDIVREYIADTPTAEEYVDLSDKYEIEISTVTDSIEFVESADGGIHVELDGVDESHYSIKKTNSKLEIKYKKTKFFSLNRKKDAIIRVEIPNGYPLGNVTISTASGKVDLKTIIADTFKINVVTADLKLDDIDCKDFYCHTVSGDVYVDTLTAKNLNIDTVSGDVKFDFAVADNARIDSVSGDVIITDGKIGSITSSSVSGDIIINGEEKCTNVKNYVKGIFKR